MIEFIQTITDSELDFISGLDYKQETEKHKAALKEVIFNQSCTVIEGQEWFPFEVIELGAHWLQKGHEKEFTICTLLVLLNGCEDIDHKFECRAADYDLLPMKYRDSILNMYEQLATNKTLNKDATDEVN